MPSLLEHQLDLIQDGTIATKIFWDTVLSLVTLPVLIAVLVNFPFSVVSRVYIVLKSSISLRHVPTGVYTAVLPSKLYWSSLGISDGGGWSRAMMYAAFGETLRNLCLASVKGYPGNESSATNLSNQTFLEIASQSLFLYWRTRKLP